MRRTRHRDSAVLILIFSYLEHLELIFGTSWNFLNENVYAAATYTNYDIDTYIEYNDETDGGTENDLGFMLGWRKDNLDLYFGPTYDEGSEGKIMEFGFTYFFD